MKKNKLILIAAVVFLASSLTSFLLFSRGPLRVSGQGGSSSYKAPAPDSDASIDEDAPKTEECPINGEMLTEGHRKRWESRRPLLVMVENHVDARPQSGLTSADVIYEAVAEGGITRFLTIFYCKDSDGFVGPVRSARIYFINLAESYGNYPLYTHVGGANCNRTTGSGCANGAKADALGKIRKLGWAGNNDLDHVAFPVMFRDYERLSQVTEHTVYSTTEKLWEYARKVRKLSSVDEDGVRWDEDFTPWKFKDDEPSKSPVSPISFEFWEGYGDFVVEWTYDPTSNSYKRANGGKPHTDLNNDAQITSKNVVVVMMDESIANDGYDKGEHLLYDTIGQGEAYVFLDGKVVEGVWRRKNEETLIRFYDKSGDEIELNRGQVFVEILPTGNEVSY